MSFTSLMRPALALTLALTVAACAPEPDDVTPDGDIAQATEDALRDVGPIDVEMDGLALSSDLDGTPVQAVTTQNGEVELGLTDRVLYSRLSKETQATLAAEMEAETEGAEGLGGRLARAISGAVAEGLTTAVQVPLADVRDLRTQEGRLVIEMADGEPSPFEHTETNGRPMLEQVSEADARRLAEAFDRIRGK